MSVETEIQWKQTDMVEVVLNEPDDFLKVRETLTRIGVASRKEKKIYQSCHILLFCRLRMIRVHTSISPKIYLALTPTTLALGFLASAT